MGAILYSFRRCPFAMRARMSLMASGAAYEHREIILRDKPASMLKFSPKATVPVFITDGGEVIDESLDIALWALSRSDPQGWLTPNKGQMLALIARSDGPFKHHLDRYKYASRYSETAKRGDTDSGHREKACEFIAALEQRLENGPYLMGNKPSLADIAIFPFVRQFAAPDRAWWDGAPYPRTQVWLEKWLTSELFLTAMEKREVWRDDAQ